MKVSAHIQNRAGQHVVTLQTGDTVQGVVIPPKPSGSGSSINGGELLFLALATCYCNDLYREALKRNIKVDQVEVEVSGEFGDEGEPAHDISYRARVTAQANPAQIQELMRETDRKAEIQNTLRRGNQVTFTTLEAVSV